MDNSLLSFYDGLKKSQATDDDSSMLVNVNGINGDRWRAKAVNHSHHLCDKCCKHLLLDVYVKILPLDDDFKCGHMGKMCGDVDNMLAAKGMTATQYLKSCSESADMPFINYILTSVDRIGSQYMREREAELKEARENNVKILEPVEPDVECGDVAACLDDIKGDDEYKIFIAKLKDKTAKTIIDDISNVINKEKENNSLQYKPQEESATEMCVNYINKKLWNEKADDGSKTEDILGLAIRESTFRELDKAFGIAIPFNEFKSDIYFGKGCVITEAAINELR